MPFTALKLVELSLLSQETMRCAPPNAVYGIETFNIQPYARIPDKGCAPPNAVYGIETTIMSDYI